jgi:hypothetical protein
MSAREIKALRMKVQQVTWGEVIEFDRAEEACVICWLRNFG